MTGRVAAQGECPWWRMQGQGHTSPMALFHVFWSPASEARLAGWRDLSPWAGPVHFSPAWPRGGVECPVWGKSWPGAG